MNRKNLPAIIILLLVALSIILIASPNFEEEQSRSFGSDDPEQGIHLPATGVWNGFLGHMVVAEFSNLDTSPADLEYSLNNSANEEIGSENIVIAGNSTQHLILNKFPIIDDYGTIIVKSKNPSQSPKISSFIVTYRMDGDKGVQYATSMPLSSPTYGSSIGVYNSMNPDPSMTNPVFNWLSVYNPGDTDFSAKIIIRDEKGEVLPNAEINIKNLKPGGRIDNAVGHPIGQVVGSYEILPENPEIPYGAFLSRYSKVSDEIFNFSMSIPSSSGYSDSGLLPASTMGHAFNWAEIANFSNGPAKVLLELFDGEGVVLLTQETELDAFSQKHIFLNEYLGSLNVGYFRVKSLGDMPAKLVVQSLYYGHNDANDSAIAWAYNTSGNGGDYVDQATYPINTNIGAPNWLKLYNPNTEQVELSLQILDQSGKEINIGDQTKVSLKGTLDIPIHTLVGPDVVGVVKVNVINSDLLFQGQIIRVYSGDGTSSGRSRGSAFSSRSLAQIAGIRYITPFQPTNTAPKGLPSYSLDKPQNFPSYGPAQIFIPSKPLFAEVDKLFKYQISYAPYDAKIYLYSNVPGLNVSLDGKLTFEPRENQKGQVKFLVAASNRIGIDVKEFTINVIGSNNPGNKAPYFSPAPSNVLNWPKGLTYYYYPKASDPDPNDIPKLSFDLVGNTSGAILFPKTGSGATFAFNPQQAGSYTFSIKVSDPLGASQTNSFTVTVKEENPNNKPPQINAFENPIVGFAGQRKDYAFTSTPPGATFTLVSNGGLSGLGLGTTGQLFFVPAAHQVGTYYATIRATNPFGTKDATATIKVQNLTGNAPPVIGGLPSMEVQFGKPVNFTITASDPNSDKVSIRFQGDSFGATLTPTNDIKNSHQFSWLPTKLGSHIFTLEALDGKGGRDTRLMGLTVTNPPPTNRPPEVTNPGTITIRTNEEWTGRLVSSDPDGDVLTTNIYTTPYAPVGFSTDSSGAMGWSPRDGQEGTYRFSYTVWDRRNPAVGGYFYITVVRYNPPTYTINSVGWGQRTIITGTTFEQQWRAQKNYRDLIPINELEFQIREKPTFSTLSNSGLFRWTPSGADIGKRFDITAFIEDDYGISTLGRQAVVVVAQNTPPRLPRDWPTHYATYVARQFTLGIPFTDPDGDRVVCEQLQPSRNTGINVSSNCVLTFTAIDSQAYRTFNVSVKGYDGTNSTYANFSIRVVPRRGW